MSTRRVSLAAVALAALLAVGGLVAPPTGAATALTPSLATSATETTWSEYITLTAMFTPPKGQPKPTGTVTFTDAEDATVGSIPLANGVARLRTRGLPAGTHTITATHQGDDTYPAGTTAGPVTVTVTPASTTTSLVSKKTEVMTGSAWFQATVAPVAPAGGTPTGSVEFTVNNATTPAATVPLVGGIATWRPRLADGTYIVFASYTGTASQLPSTSNPVDQRVGPEPSESPVDQANTSENPESLAMPTLDAPYAQTVTTGRNGWLDRVDLYVGAGGDSDLMVRVLAVGEDGLPTGPVLGSGRTFVHDGTVGPVSLVLDVPIPVRTGERYALVAISPAEQIFLAHDSTDTYPGGAMLAQLGGEWSPMGPTDLWFRTHVAPWATTELTVSTATAAFSQPVDLSARWTVARNAPAPTGTVRFLADGQEIGSAPITGGTARLRTRALPLGDHTVTATYDGDDAYDAEPVTGSPTVTVTPLATATTLVSRRNPVPSGTAWFQAAVAPVAPATAAPDGEVAFFLDGDTSPTATVPLSAGVASWRPRLADGPHTVTAGFVPSDGTQEPSTSAAVNQHIGPTPAAAGSIDQSNPGPAETTFAVPETVVAQTFTAGATGMLHRVAYEAPWGSDVSVAIHPLDQTGHPTGEPLGSAGLAYALGYTERALDTPVPIEAGERYGLVLTAPNGLGISLSMGGYAGGDGFALTSGTWLNLFGYDLIFATWVRPIPPSVASFTASTTDAVATEYVTLTARWTSPDGGPLPTGTVRFLDDGVELGTATISDGVAGLRTKALGLGGRTVTAVYDGNHSFPPGPVGEPTTVTVAPATTTTTLVSKKPEVLSGSAWFQATVAPVAPATATPTGSVAFHLDGSETPAAIVPLASGVATWRPRLDDGSYTVTAVFLGTATHDTSTGTPLVQLIGPS